MKFFSGFTRLASLPPWASKINHDGVDGYWTDAGKNKVFLNTKNLVHFPKTLRGKSITDLRQEDFDAVPKEDQGDVHYDLWREDFDRKRQADKIFSDYKFTPMGQILIDRLRKYLLKCKLDDVTQLGLDGKYSINPAIFDKMLATPHVEKVRQYLKTVAKKYRMIITLLEDQGKQRLAKKYDRDFYFNWDKLAPLADFDAASYKPKVEAKEREDEEEDAINDNVALEAKNKFIQDAEPLLDPQMGPVFAQLEALSRAVDDNDMIQAESALEHLAALLLGFTERFEHHPIAEKATQILTLPSFTLLHSKIVGEPN
jgi:hypothetical protein